MSSRRQWAETGFAALCAVWFLRKVVWSNPGSQWDFSVYYHAAQAWRTGLDPYDPSVLPQALREIGLTFSYPPYTLGLFMPFAALPLRAAALLYVALKVVALAWLIRLWSGLLAVRVTDPGWVLFLLFGYSSAIFIDFSAGSVTTFEQLVIWLGIAAFLQRKYWTYVAAVVISSLLRVTPIGLLAVCLAAQDRRRFRYLAAGVAGFTGVLALTYAVSPDLMHGFLRSIAGNLGERGHLNPSTAALVLDVTELLSRTYHVPVAFGMQAVIYLVLAVVIGSATAFAATRASAAGASRMEPVTYLSLLAYALVVPRFKNYSCMLLLVPTFYIATRASQLRRSTPLLLLACLPIYSWITTAENVRLVANYSQWLIALGAWSLYLYELSGGDLRQRGEGLPCPS